jgi:hypothetical protein
MDSRKRHWTPNPSSSGDEEDTAKAVTAAHSIAKEIRGLLHIARKLDGDQKEELRAIAKKIEKRHDEMKQSISQQAGQIDVLGKELHFARKEYKELRLKKKKHATDAAKKCCTTTHRRMQFIDEEAEDDE